VFEDSRRRRALLSFVGRTRALGEAAAQDGLALSWLHYHASRWVELGLLKVVGEHPRWGRPVKLYAAAAEAFFVADEHLHRSEWAGLARELDEALRKARGDNEGSGVMFSVADGRPSMARVGGPSKRPSAQMWLIMELDDAEAADLAAEMDALFRRYGRSQAKGRRPYMLHAALAPRPR
jgi:hypothetical protein